MEKYEDENLKEGYQLYSLGHYREAEQQLRLSMKERPGSDDDFLRLDLLARTLLAQGKLGLAERAARKLSREADDLESCWLLASILYYREKFAEAETLFQDIVEENSNYNKGGILGRVVLRRKWKEEGKKFRPDPERRQEAYFLYLQYRGYMALKIYREAQFAIEQALELDPDDCLLHETRADFELFCPHYCQQCGERVHEGWRKCQVCGQSLSFPSPIVYHTCPFCGVEVDTLWNCCPYCGRDPGQTTLPLEEPPE